LWSVHAADDLLSIWQYGAEEWSPSVADEHEYMLWRACGRLLENVHLGRPRDELIVGLRSMVVNPHAVFYRMSATAIEIVRVVHPHEDVDTIFEQPPYTAACEGILGTR
jgi:toxin ParE1/3/4